MVKKKKATQMIVEDIEKGVSGKMKPGAIAKMIEKSVKKALAPLPRAPNVSKRRVVPIRRSPIQRAPQTRQAIPTSVRQLQYTPNLWKLLSPVEKAQVVSSMPALQRYNAMQILRKRLKDQEKFTKQPRQTITEVVDPFSSKRTMVEKKQIPVEAWLR